MVITGDRALRLRAMCDDDGDYALVAAWRNRPHVREWWDPDDPPMTPEQAADQYRPCIAGGGPDRLAIIEVDEVPAGFIQWYPWAAYPTELAEMGLTAPAGAWGLDVFIGEPNLVGRGIGTRVVRLLIEHLLGAEGATAVAFGVDVLNARARRAYEKAGMEQVGEYLDTDTRGGERVRAMWLVRRSPSRSLQVRPAASPSSPTPTA